MLNTLRRKLVYPAIAVGTGVLWGLVEFFALQRAAAAGRRQRTH